MIDLIVVSTTLLAFWTPGPGEMLLLAVVALLLYGGQLPEVARSWGKTFAEFRRGLNGIQNDINEAIYSEPERLEYRPESTTPYLDENYPEEYVASTSAETAKEAEEESHD